MKLILKPLKWILKIIIGILIIPAILLVFLWKPIKVPKEHYSNQSVTLQGAVTESVDTFLEQETNKKPLSLTLDSQVVNNEIRNQLLEQLNSADPTDLDYVYKEGRVLFQGAWVSYKKDTLNINAGVHIDSGFMKFKTRLLLRFKVIDTDGIIELKLTKFNLGNIPLAWASGFAANIVKKTMKVDLEEMVQEKLGTMGEFDIKKRTLKIDLRKIAAQGDDNQELIEMMINLIYSEELIKFGINEKGDEYALGLDLNLDKLEDNTPAPIITNRIQNEVELNAFLATKLDLSNAEILQTLLTTKPKINLTENEINRVLDYFLAGNLANNEGIMEEMEFYEDYKVLILNPYLSLESNATSVNVPIRFSKDGGNVFMTTLKLSTEISVDGKDLIFDVKAINFGSVTIEASYIESVLTLFGEGSELFSEGAKIVVKDFAENFEQEGLKFDGLTVLGSNLVITFEIDGLTLALEDISDDPDVPVEIKDLIDDLLLDPTDEDAINDLIDAIEELTPAEQQDIYDKLQAAFDALNP